MPILIGGESRCLYLGPYLLVSGTIGHDLWVRVVGTNTAHEEGVGRIPPQGDRHADERQPRRGRDRGCFTPRWRMWLVYACLQEVDTYISCFQNTVAQYIETMTIMYLYLVVKRRLGPSVAKRWWEQEGFYLVGMWTASWKVEQTEGG